jgi:hypothetical protein
MRFGDRRDEADRARLIVPAGTGLLERAPPGEGGAPSGRCEGSSSALMLGGLVASSREERGAP